MPICKTEGCNKEAKRMGICYTCESRIRNHGSPYVYFGRGNKIQREYNPTDGIPWKPTGTKFCEWSFGR